MKKFRAGPDDVGSRLDVFLARKYPQFSRASLDPLFDSGLVFRNKKPAKQGDRLRASDAIGLDEKLLFKKPDVIKLPVLYEDDDVVVVDKPAGVLTHSKGALNLEATVASFVKDKIVDKNLSGNRAGIVHRLDRATSGLIIAAKTEAAQKYLQRQFSNRKVTKVYQAIVIGWPKPTEALIDAPIERDPKRPQTFRVGQGGKSAQTRYRSLEHFEKDDKKYALLELSPITGRTHQLRVHLAYIGSPVLGDNLYGKGGGELYLHAHSLKLHLPSGQQKKFTSALPDKFKRFRDNV